MRRSFAVLLAAATAIGASAASFAPAQAASWAPQITTGGGIEQVRDRERWGGDWDRGHDNGWRHHRRHHRHHRDDFGGFPGFSFSFGVPQAYYRPYHPYYQPYYGYGDCFRTWDGQLICR
jgi:hypothetical protein